MNCDSVDGERRNVKTAQRFGEGAVSPDCGDEGSPHAEWNLGQGLRVTGCLHQWVQHEFLSKSEYLIYCHLWF